MKKPKKLWFLQDFFDGLFDEMTWRVKFDSSCHSRKKKEIKTKFIYVVYFPGDKNIFP